MKWFGLEVRDPALDGTVTIMFSGKNRHDAKTRYLKTHYWMEVISIWEL